LKISLFDKNPTLFQIDGSLFNDGEMEQRHFVRSKKAAATLLLISITRFRICRRLCGDLKDFSF